LLKTASNATTERVSVAPSIVPENLSDDGVKKASYGADISWPMQHDRVSTNYPWLPHNVDPENNPIPVEYIGMPLQPLGDRQKAFEEFMQGCRESAKERAFLCDEYQKGNVVDGLNQPPRMTNYTDLGFKKIRAPEAIFKLIREFWEANKHLEQEEVWEPGNIITNSWAVPSTMVAVEDDTLPGGGHELQSKIYNMANEIIQEWTGQKSFPTSVYGIRVYKDGAILAPHVDRLPLVSSMIINVDQDVDEDWVLEVIGHDGHAYNVTQKPGDLVLYESHSIIHGRPFPLKGRYYANIFIHFAPLTAIEDGVASARDDLSGTLSEEETGSKVTSASDAAAFGDLAYLQEIAEKDPTLLFQKDENLWQPIHEAARSGNLAILEYLVAQGADINARTYFNQTVLDAALYFTKDETHPLIQKLRELGATSSGIIDFEVEDEETEEEADELEDEEADALADEF